MISAKKQLYKAFKQLFKKADKHKSINYMSFYKFKPAH